MSSKVFVPRRQRTLRLLFKAQEKAVQEKYLANTFATPDSPSTSDGKVDPPVSRPSVIVKAKARTRVPRLRTHQPQAVEVFMSDPNVTIKSLAERRADVFMVKPDNLVVVTTPGHPLYDERVNLPVEPGLVASIIEHGIRQAVTVRRNGSLFEVEDGRQRVKAAIEANKQLKKTEQILVPVTMSKDNDVQAAKIMIALNEQRVEDTPMVKAAKAKRLLDYHISKAEVAAQFGKPVSWLNELLKLLETDDSVQRGVDKGLIAVTAASKLSSLSREEQKKAMADLRDSGRVIGRATVKAKVKAVREAKRTGQAERALVLPPKRSVVVAVCDAYESTRARASDERVALPGKDGFATVLLKWVLTGSGARDILPGPGTFDTLADFLVDLETAAKLGAKASKSTT